MFVHTQSPPRALFLGGTEGSAHLIATARGAISASADPSPLAAALLRKLLLLHFRKNENCAGFENVHKRPPPHRAEQAYEKKLPNVIWLIIRGQKSVLSPDDGQNAPSSLLRLQDGSSSKLHHAARGICCGDCWGGHNRLEDASKEESCEAHVPVGEALRAQRFPGAGTHLHAPACVALKSCGVDAHTDMRDEMTR